MVKILIYIHAFFGAIALVSGGVALISKKGKRIHKKSGKAFLYSMLISVVLSIIIAVLPYHENFLLFAIGFFSLYFLVSGNNALQYKKQKLNLKSDKIIAYAIMGIGLGMIFYPFFKTKSFNIILLIFGIVSILFGFRDMYLLNNVLLLKQSWLKLHIVKMTSGYIAAISAFFVVNNFLPTLWNWFAPGIVGSVYITFWMVKLNLKEKL